MIFLKSKKKEINVYDSSNDVWLCFTFIFFDSYRVSFPSSSVSKFIRDHSEKIYFFLFSSSLTSFPHLNFSFPFRDQIIKTRLDL